MEASYYVIIVICNLMKVFALYRIFNYIFNKDKYSVAIETVTFIIFAIANSAVYFLVNIPLLTMSLNLVGYLLLTLNYRGHFKQKLFAAVFFLIGMMLLECLVVFISANLSINVFERSTYSVLGDYIFSALLAYLAAEIIIHRQNIKNRVNLPILYLLGFLVTPIASFVIITYITTLSDATMKGLAICCIAFLIINIAVFYLYDKIIAYVAQQKEHEAVILQNRNYHYMLENMKSSVDSTRQLKHDLKNHAVAMESLVNDEKYDELKDYLKNIFRDVAGTEIDTGNTTIDSILNFKMEECKNKGIEFSPTVAVPTGLKVPYDILTMVMGNLLDNAIEATENVTEDRKIRFRLFYKVGYLYLDLENPYRGELQMKKGEYLSTKPASEYHGYGLKNIQKALDRNGGHMTIETKDQRFIVHIIMDTQR